MSSSTSSTLQNFFFRSPKSIRNFVGIFVACTALDIYYQHHNASDTIIKQESNATTSFSLFNQIVLPLAQSPMIEPVVAVLSFLFACLVFSISEPYYYRYYSSSTRKNDNKNKNSDSSPPPIIQGNIVSWAFWAFSNIGLYLGIIYLFQRLTLYNQDSFYYVSKSWYDGVDAKRGFVYTRIFLEVFTSIFLYDFVFAFFHRVLFHRTQTQQVSSISWFQKLHLIHHDYYADAGKKPLHVMNTFHHHIIDASIQIFINAALQQVVALSFGSCPTSYFAGAENIHNGFCDDLHFSVFPKRHIMSKILHNVIVTYLLVESHSGQDWFWMTHRWLFPEWFNGGATAHQKHHDTGKAPFHQFFTIFDGEF